MQLRRKIGNADTQTNIARGAQHAKEMEWGEERRTGKVPWRGEGIGSRVVDLPGACGMV